MHIELEAIKSQDELTAKITSAQLTAAEWKAMSREVLGRSARSGKDAREMLHQHYSDNLLMLARIEQVKKLFNG